jgi:DNA recombination protein RmuC
VESTGLLSLGFSLIALIFGAALAWLIASRPKAVFEERARQLAGQVEQARAAAVAAETVAAEKARSLAATLEQRAARISELEAELAAARASQAENAVRLNTFIAETEKRFTDTFKSLASQILEEKTAKFTATNETKLNELLNPFRDRLKEFQKKIEDTHLSETTERRSLKDLLINLRDLNQQVSQDTKNLTAALKGEAKTQGTWGEIILERVLEMSGLTRGREYEVQDSRISEDGSRQQPDVVIRLPPDRNLIVDSKVSMVAFERYSSADNDEDRAEALAQHLASVRNHIRGLSEKNYPALYGLESLDFVLMFVPVEPAFLVAVQADTGLYDAAWSRNVVLVSPTTLMATARVVESVWRLERQNRNVKKIAEQAGRMHDAFVSFVLELEKAVRQFQSAGESLDSAMTKLHTGRGNLVRRADEIRKLGAKAAKSLPANLLEQSEDETEEDGDGVEPETDAETGLESDPQSDAETDQSLRH